MSNIINVSVIVIFLLCWILIIKKFIINRCAEVTTVSAKVVDKYKANIVSKYFGTFRQERYIVVFEMKNKKLSFDISEFSYNNYKINQRGMLNIKVIQL